jgi:hypothetical protein
MHNVEFLNVEPGDTKSDRLALKGHFLEKKMERYIRQYSKSQSANCTILKHGRYKVVQIWPGLIVCKQVTVCPGHIWTTLYFPDYLNINLRLWQLTLKNAHKHFIKSVGKLGLLDTLVHHKSKVNQKEERYIRLVGRSVEIHAKSLSQKTVLQMPTWMQHLQNTDMQEIPTCVNKRAHPPESHCSLSF